MRVSYSLKPRGTLLCSVGLGGAKAFCQEPSVSTRFRVHLAAKDDERVSSRSSSWFPMRGGDRNHVSLSSGATFYDRTVSQKVRITVSTEISFPTYASSLLRPGRADLHRALGRLLGAQC